MRCVSRYSRVHQNSASHPCGMSEGSLLLPRGCICSSGDCVIYCIVLCSGLLFSGAVPRIDISGDLFYFTILSKFKQSLISNPHIIKVVCFFFFNLLLRGVIPPILGVQVVLVSGSDFIDTMMFMRKKAISGHVYDFVKIYICWELAKPHQSELGHCTALWRMAFDSPSASPSFGMENRNVIQDSKMNMDLLKSFLISIFSSE